MYLTEFDIRDIKCFEHVHLTFPHVGKDDYSGWNVLLGGNGTGKSTLLQAMAISLVGPLAGSRLLTDPSGWSRKAAKKGEFGGQIVAGIHDSPPLKKACSASFAITGEEEVEIEGETYDQPQLVHFRKNRLELRRGPYAAIRRGWMSCGYGPFRRLTGSAEADLYDVVHPRNKGRNYATLFREGSAITDCLDWLISLYNLTIDPQIKDKLAIGTDFYAVKDIVNSLLPSEVQIINVDSRNVYFQTIGGGQVTAPDLSDGYRSFLALSVDLLRNIYEALGGLALVVEKPGDFIRVRMEGVVLIDEVDAHLHPRWQREIGFRLRRAFPKIQFIVTSHSPFVAQAASDHGLFVLRQPEGKGSVEVIQPVESVRGWRADQILTDRSLFDLEGTRDLETERWMGRHADLVAKREWGQLTPAERKELVALEGNLADRLTAPGESFEEREKQAAMDRYIAESLANLNDEP